MRVVIWFVLIANVISVGLQVSMVAVDASVPPFVPLLCVGAHLIIVLILKDAIVSRRI